MDLNTVWFILIGILYAGYFILEGFDFGVGMLLPFLGKNDTQRRMIINTIGPHWDGNEVWLLTAGGATFAAFPHWYATLFSGFYLPLLLMLLALIIRGVAFEFRSKDENPIWRNAWDWAIAVGSFIPALLWGVAFANIVKGVPIDVSKTYIGGFWNLLNVYALVGGLAFVLLFLVQGSAFLKLKTEGEVSEKARHITRKAWLPALLTLGLFAILSNFYTDIFSREGVVIIATLFAVVLGLAALLTAGWFVRQGKEGLVFIFTSLALLCVTATLFLGLYPRVMISSLNPDWTLTIYNSASGPNTLGTMGIIALVFVPIVLAYQAWSYWVFRRRISEKTEKLEY